MKRSIVVAAAVMLLARAPAQATDALPEWMTDEGGVLELKLAHEDKNRIDGGILRVDRNHKVLLWEGIPGEIGCKIKLETRFEDVEAVKIGDQAGFTLEVRRGKPKKLVLLPVTHAEWFLKQHRIREGMATTMAQSGDLRVSGPGGGDRMWPSGSAASAGPSIKKVELPELVVRDTRRAAEAVRSALEIAPARP